MDDWCVRYLARSDEQFSCNSQIICGQIMHARQGGKVGPKVNWIRILFCAGRPEADLLFSSEKFPHLRESGRPATAHFYSLRSSLSSKYALLLYTIARIIYIYRSRDFCEKPYACWCFFAARKKKKQHPVIYGRRNWNFIMAILIMPRIHPFTRLDTKSAIKMWR